NFFFFQAEDGIRDKLVTGVQTCALPIYSSSRRHQCVIGQKPSFHEFLVDDRHIVGIADLSRDGPLQGGERGCNLIGLLNSLLIRSEERRVGKECRARWWSYHCKKGE